MIIQTHIEHTKQTLRDVEEAERLTVSSIKGANTGEIWNLKTACPVPYVCKTE